MAIRVGLLDLPNELLRHIKSLWHSCDLTSNVCFFQLSARTAACFDGKADGDRYWELLCRANGLGSTCEDKLDLDYMFLLRHSFPVRCARSAVQKPGVRYISARGEQ